MLLYHHRQIYIIMIIEPIRHQFCRCSDHIDLNKIIMLHNVFNAVNFDENFENGHHKKYWRHKINDISSLLQCGYFYYVKFLIYVSGLAGNSNCKVNINTYIWWKRCCSGDCKNSKDRCCAIKIIHLRATFILRFCILALIFFFHCVVILIKNSLYCNKRMISNLRVLYVSDRLVN